VRLATPPQRGHCTLSHVRADQGSTHAPYLELDVGGGAVGTQGGVGRAVAEAHSVALDRLRPLFGPAAAGVRGGGTRG